MMKTVLLYLIATAVLLDMKMVETRVLTKVIVKEIRFKVQPTDLHSYSSAKVYSIGEKPQYEPRPTPSISADEILNDPRDSNELLQDYVIHAKMDPTIKLKSNDVFSKHDEKKHGHESHSFNGNFHSIFNNRKTRSSQFIDVKLTNEGADSQKSVDNTNMNFSTENLETSKVGDDNTVENLIQGAKIIGGSHSQPNAWPWQASIQYYGVDGNWHHFCGGSLIHSLWVVTAAHCVYRLEDYIVRVVLGDDQLSYFSYTEQVINPARMFMHGYYNESSYYFDIAMIQLSDHAEMTRYVATVEMATTKIDSFSSNDVCYIAGWGSTETQYTSDLLQQSRMTVITRQQCRNIYGNLIVDSQVCILSDTASACTGDSGGPLVCAAGNEWYLTGVASVVGDSDCTPSFPNVYTRMSTFFAWANSVMEQY